MRPPLSDVNLDRTRGGLVARFADGGEQVLVPRGKDREFLAGVRATPHGCDLSPDGRTLAWGDSDGNVGFWDLKLARPLALHFGYHRDVRCVAFAPDNRTLASGGASGGGKGGVILWDVTPDLEVERWAHPVEVRVVAFSPDGKQLASGDEAGRVRARD